MRILVFATVTIILAALAPVAQADIVIGFGPAGGTTTTCGPLSGPGPVACSNVAGPPFNIEGLMADSNSPGNTGSSQLNSAVLSIQNATGSTQTLLVAISANNFSEPTGKPLTFVSAIGGTVANAILGNSLTYQSCIDPTNSLITMAFVCNSKPGAILSGLSNPVNGIVTPPGAFEDSQITTTTASLTSPYAIDESFIVSLGPGGEVNFNASTSLVAAPEPGSGLLLAIGLVGFVAFTRRRPFQRRLA